MKDEIFIEVEGLKTKLFLSLSDIKQALASKGLIVLKQDEVMFVANGTNEPQKAKPVYYYKERVTPEPELPEKFTDTQIEYAFDSIGGAILKSILVTVNKQHDCIQNLRERVEKMEGKDE
jgi:hypothetical protein